MRREETGGLRRSDGRCSAFLRLVGIGWVFGWHDHGNDLETWAGTFGGCGSGVLGLAIHVVIKGTIWQI